MLDMVRNKTKNSDAVSFRIRKDINQRLSNYSESSRIPKTAIVEMALEEYLSKVAPTEKNKK